MAGKGNISKAHYGDLEGSSNGVSSKHTLVNVSSHYCSKMSLLSF